jgi:threonine/homoserine/homoserine lactone efflux protein
MESIWSAIFTFLGVFTFAIISPGPNFILVTNTALNRSRAEGLLTATGVATGSGIFAFAGLVGLLPLVHALPHFAEIMRFVGGGYLAWIGLDMLRTCRREIVPEAAERKIGLSAMVPYRTGMLTNLTNPKAWAFYLSLFTLVMGPTLPLWGKVFLNISMFLISLIWYVAVAYLVSSRTFQPLFLSWRPVIQGVLGGLLIAVGGKILLG